MKVSVIVPCYNCEKTVGATIRAILGQTARPAEIILVDDGSTDGTRKIISGFGKAVKYLRQKNAGPAVARNRGAKEAAGDIIVFTDSDCVPESGWLEEMARPFADKKVSGVQGAYKTKQNELVARFGQIEIEERYARMKKAKAIDWIGSYSAAFRRNEFLALKGFDETFPIASGEDPEFSFRLSKNGGRLVFNPEAVVYHSHPKSIRKYLRTKFFRAYYRPKMYSGHKEKALNDSYTPQILKAQIPLSLLAALSLVSVPLIGPIPFTALVIIFLATTLPFFLFAAKRDFVVALASPGMVFLRSFVFGFGLAAGVARG